MGFHRQFLCEFAGAEDFQHVVTIIGQIFNAKRTRE